MRWQVPVPSNKEVSSRMRFDAPVRAEMHWKATGPPARRNADAWEKEEEPVTLPPGGLSWRMW